jgi:hypothetical protein
MRKIYLFLLLGSLVLISAGCGQGTTTGSQGNPAGKSKGIEDVCNYFPKELIEEAISKPIVKVEVPIMGEKNCFYYTQWSETFDHTPYGDVPGGTPVVVVYDEKDFAKDKASNEQGGSKYTKDETISMDNYVVRDHGGTIWQVVLILGNDKYIRMHFVHQAITGPELVKIGARFAQKIQTGK